MARYNCAACEDPKQGEAVVKGAEYVARDNVPKYWALCHYHYLRADEKLKLHYANITCEKGNLP